jgi:hypothetical protein
MGDRIPKWAYARRAVVAVLALMATLIAPVCAPLCAAMACSSGTAQGLGEECHGLGAMEDTAADRYSGPMKACPARELTAVLLRANKRFDQPVQAQRVSAEWSMDSRVAVADSLASFGAPALRRGEDRFALGPTSPLVQTTHLRF